ncbi:arylsulfatase [bacterium]|nr:arylsulfatase [bacterium]
MNREPLLTRRDFLSRSLLALAGCLAAKPLSGASPGRQRPNILLIMADDMGFSDIGCYGGEIRTPNLDGLAARGLRFNQFYNNGICVPTRASLLTGLYSQQVGVYGNSPMAYENCVTLGELLQSAGYRTLMAGKWHAKETPYRRGFDRHFGLCDGCSNYFNPGPQRQGEPAPGRKKSPGGYPRRWAIDDQEYRPYAPMDARFYSTDAFTDYAVRYLEEYNNEEKPFFLYLAYTCPHYPLHAWPEDIARYRGRYLVGWDVIRRQRFERIRDLHLFDRSLTLPARDEDVPAWEDVADKDGWDLKMAVYAAMIDRMDQNIGRVLQKIRQLGKEENTLVLFLSDNGGCAEDVNHTPGIAPGPMESYCSVDKPWANASNTPFRKYKSTDHEGGICTPFIAAWPGVIQQQGKICNAVAHLIDVLPTLAEISGAQYPAEYNGRTVLPMEGASLVPIFQGLKQKKERTLFWRTHRDSHRAVRRGAWKLVSADPEAPWQLYDLKHDRFETRDLSFAHPDRVKEMAELYAVWERKVGLDRE